MASSNLSTRERLRLRELSKYYCSAPSVAPGGLPGQDGFRGGSAATTPATVQATDYFSATSTFKLRAPCLSSDPTLTAFAQLAAVRMNCHRAMISIIDSDAQHVLAEATRTISPFDQTVHAPGDSLLIGAQSLPRSYGICPFTMDVFLDKSNVSFIPGTVEADSTKLIICDLAAHEHTRALPFVEDPLTDLRYYAEVPLTTSAGYVAGTLSVIDNAPRAKPCDEDISILTGLSKIIMNYLDSVRMRHDYHRAERLMQGLTHFIQGQSSISHWLQDTAGQTSSCVDETEYQATPTTRKTRTTSFAPIFSHPTTPMSEQPPDVISQSGGLSVKSASVSGVTSVAARAGEDSLDIRSALASTVRPSVTRENSFFADHTNEKDDSAVQNAGDPVYRAMRHAFSKASNLIRESMDLDATCFLEAPTNGRYHRGKNDKKPKTFDATLLSPFDDQNMKTDSSKQPTTTSDSEVSAPGDAGHPDTIPDDLNSTTEDLVCEKLGFSTRLKSSVANDVTKVEFMSITGSLLNRMSTKYPDGHIFHFDQVGSITSGEDAINSQGSEKSIRKARRNMNDRVSWSFPNARSLIFLPLYDNSKQHIYAAFLGWTTNPARALRRNEIIYVASFTNSVMCEVMRLQTLATDQAKSEFISSISHELRSPLHGIQAAADLLQDSSVTPQQNEFVVMIDTCVRTLLDLMDHLLDHAKINHFTRSHDIRKKRKILNRTKSQQQTYSLVSKVNLARLLEETITSLAAGHVQQARNTRTAQATKQTNDTKALPADEGREETSIKNAPIPFVLLDIQRCENWTFESEAGAWRRLILNLVGNSLKYTQEGHVRVSLRATVKPTIPGRISGTTVTLTVTDTGRGISEDYLKHRLYTPFAQENNLTVGAGLGLSLVKQIVSSLRGTINVQSQIGLGTEITISVPLGSSCQPAVSGEINSSMPTWAEMHQTLAGKTACFLGFDVLPPMDEQPTGVLDPHARTIMTTKQILANIGSDWFGLKFGNQPSTPADVWIMEESFFHTQKQGSEYDMNKILVVSTSGNDSVLSLVETLDADTLFPPIGPTAFGKALLEICRRGHERRRFLAAPETTLDNGIQRAASVPPSVTSSQNIPRAPSGTKSEPRPRRRRILLVDDNDINLKILVTYVAKLGLPYLTASDGQQAFDLYCAASINGNPVDYVLMDISMPVMNGFTSTSKIRAWEIQNRPGDKAKIIALTGLASEQAQQDARDSGFDLFFRKPVKLSVIRDLLANDLVLVDTKG